MREVARDTWAEDRLMVLGAHRSAFAPAASANLEDRRSPQFELGQERHRTILRNLGGHSVAVLGDLMLDEYLWGSASRISPEAPVMVLDVNRESCGAGGAANVAANLLALGAHVTVIGVIGGDRAGELLVSNLQSAGADLTGIIIDSSRPTTRKTRIVAHHQQVLRLDRESSAPISDGIAEQLLAQLNQAISSAEAVIISDYNKGVVTSRLGRAAVDLGRRHGVILTANPKPTGGWSLAGADVISLNQSEAHTMLGDYRFGAAAVHRTAGEILAQQLQVRALLITLGAAGLSLWHSQTGFWHVPAQAREVCDVAGAGDTVISALTLALAAGATVEEAAFVANHAAGCVVCKVGVATVTREELAADLTR